MCRCPRAKHVKHSVHVSETGTVTRMLSAAHSSCRSSFVFGHALDSTLWSHYLNHPLSSQIPCWDSFHINPLRWRGPCCGRTCRECYWTGLRQTRWARTAYAANLGREYVMPVRGVGGHGYQSEIKALCWMYFLMGCIFSCGIGQVFTLCGNVGFNFAAIYSCHAREKIRRRYHLPSSLGLPPGIDDFLVHTCCFYCASHQ